jgi:hypothetical protein
MPCSQRVQFRFVVPGHVYTAEVDGYDERADALTPLGGDGSGSRHMQCPPRWSTSCHQEVTAVDGTTVLAAGCDPLRENEPADEDETCEATMDATAVAVDPTAALGALRCASAGGEIATFNVLSQSGLSNFLDIPCPPVTPLVYTVGDIAAGETFLFRIDAAGPPTGPFPGPTYSAACSATAASGLTVTAVCDPLTAAGALTIPIASILEAAGLTCSAGAGGATTYIAALTLLDGSALQTLLPCTESARFAPLHAGTYSASVDVLGEAGTLRTATCDGIVVEVGATTVATCPLDPSSP